MKAGSRNAVSKQRMNSRKSKYLAKKMRKLKSKTFEIQRHSYPQRDDVRRKKANIEKMNVKAQLKRLKKQHHSLSKHL